MFGKIVIISWILHLCVFKVNSEVIDVSTCDGVARRGDGIVCYSVTKTTGSQEVARQQCQAAGKTLLSIASAMENIAVVDLMTSNSLTEAWIGAVQVDTNWQWNGGSELLDQGCFSDNSTVPDMVDSTILADNSNSTCMAHCSGLHFKYAALEDGTQCRCGNDFGRYGQNMACSTNCPGSQTENCGGPSAQHVFAINGGFSNWDVGQPNNDQGYQTCAIMDGNSNFRWNDVECYQQFGAVCKLNPSNQVSDFCDTSVSGVYLINNQCIYVIDTPMTYFDARLVCQQNGGDLIALASQAENDGISAKLQQVAPTARYWIGLTRMSWNWTDQESLFYTNWYSNQPSSPTLNCASINRNNDGGKWTNVDCATPRFSICQKCNTTTMPSPVYPHPTTTSTTRTIRIPTTTKPSLVPGKDTSSASKGSSASSASSSTASTNLGLFAAIGGAVGGALLVIVLVVIIACICCRRRKADSQEKSSEKAEEGATVIEPTYFFGIDYKTDACTESPEDSNQPDIVVCTSPQVLSGKSCSSSSSSFDFQSACNLHF